jgi:hypothetical protein
MTPTISSASQMVLKNLMGANPRNKGIIDMALGEGLSHDDIASYVSTSGLTEQQRRGFEQKLRGKENLRKLLNVLKTGASVATAGVGAYTAYKGASVLAKAMMGTDAEEKPNLAQSMLGMGAKKIGSKLVSGAESALKRSPVLSGLASIATGVAKAFGFKTKGLVDAVKGIVDATGKDISEVYKELSKSGDISDPEKATQAALAQLKNLKQKPLNELSQEELNETLTNRQSAQKKLNTAAPIEESRKKLAKSLKSSVIRKMNYNDDSNELDVIFNNGDTYRYFDFQPEAWGEISAAGTPAKTSGKNQYGVWWVGKDPSLGATFNKVIKPSLKEAGPYAYEKIGNSSITDEEAQELEKLQPLAGKAEKLISSEEKARKIAKKRKLLKPQTKPALGIVEEAEEYLRKLDQEGTIRGKKRRPFVAKELDRLSKTQQATGARESGFYLKRLVDLLDENTKKEIGAKLKDKSEDQVLRFVLKLLKRRVKK